MGGRMYLGNQMVTPVIIQGGGEQNPFPVKAPPTSLTSLGYSDYHYTFGFLYNGYTDNPFYFDGSGVVSIEALDSEGIGCTPWFLNAFKDSSVQYVDFSDLSHLPVSVSIIFNRLKGPFNGIISGTSGVHIYFRALNTSTYFKKNVIAFLCMGATGATVHFPSNLESIISGVDGYPNFGGTNTTIAYDLPATS